MSHQELSDAVRCANAGIHVVTIRDAGGNALFWFECASREAAEFGCGYFDAHGMEADSDSGPRRLVECRHDERLRRRPEADADCAGPVDLRAVSRPEAGCKIMISCQQ